jgi:flavin-dependent dehydrogenase
MEWPLPTGSRFDVVVIGAGPAGSSIAIWLALAGWNAVLVEQHCYPRRRVCGECIAAGNLGLLDDLGVGTEFRAIAGPLLQRVAWMYAEDTVLADLPACVDGAARFGQALGRDRLDELLLVRAKSLGVTVLQPAKVRGVRGEPGRFECDIEGSSHGTLRATMVVDARGSWEPVPNLADEGRSETARPLRRRSDLFAFKAVFHEARLAAGLLPVIAFPGGYGGMVVCDGGRTTLACCIRRDTLRACRAARSGCSAGEAVEAYLLECCQGVRETLRGARRDGAWLSVGPLRPGIRIDAADRLFRVGNAAGEAHPLIGEGISMAIQSAALLSRMLTKQPAASIDGYLAGQLQRRYRATWLAEFAPRLRLAALYAHAAMRPSFALPARAVLRRWPSLLTGAARLAGKARGGVCTPFNVKEMQ